MSKRISTDPVAVTLPEASAQPFPDITVDVTDSLCQVLLCLSSVGTTLLIPGVHGVKTLRMTPEETVYTVNCGLCNENSRRPYGELGSVDRKNCMCCVGFVMAQRETYPGCGCDGAKVDDVVTELKARMKVRGDTGQIQRIERVLEEVKELKSMLAEVNEKLDRVTAQKMSR